MSDYLKGLVQAPRLQKNMERMEEHVVGAKDQNLQYMLTESHWDHKVVMKQVAGDVNGVLGSDESALIIDESGFAKKGNHSVGVARQWNGRLGKVDNCQVGVFAALGRGNRAAIVDYRLYLPEKWTEDPARCKKAGIPEDEQKFKSKSKLALEMVKQARESGIQFGWVGSDGGYGKEPAYLRGIEDMGEIFVSDIHSDQHIYLNDPKPYLPAVTPGPGRKPSRLKTREPSVRVDNWQAKQPKEDWQTVTLRDSSKGELKVEILHQRVWLWDGQENQARHWHLIIRREIDSPSTLKYSLSNAQPESSVQQLAVMQAQRFWIEQAFRDGKSESGMADYQARKWSSWHHHMALVSMALLFMLEERERNKESLPLLSCSDIENLLKSFLPRRDIEKSEVVRQMEKRHQRRQRAIDAAYRKQMNISTT